MRHLVGSYTCPVPDDDSRFPNPAAVAEVELPDPNPAARRRSAVKMSLARAVQTWDHGHERERGREKISIRGPPKSGETFIDYWCIYLGQIPPLYIGGGEVLPPSKSRGGTKGEGQGALPASPSGPCAGGLAQPATPLPLLPLSFP